MALVGVSELAAALVPPRSKGTISKHAAAGKIPVADRDANGAPLFDVAAVQAAYENGINPLMRRRGGAVAAAGAGAIEASSADDAADDQVDDDQAGPESGGDRERRSHYAGGSAPEPSGLQRQLILERQLRNRRLVRQVADDEGLLVLRSIVENDTMTLARQTRDGVAAAMADCAGKLSAFCAQPRSEAELRVWLGEHTGQAFDQVEKAIAAEKGDEFNAESDAGEPGAPDTAAAA